MWKDLEHKTNIALGGTAIDSQNDINLLAAYKDLGDIDHIRNLVEAEQDGRIVMLPCEVGDIVYYIDFQNNVRWTTVRRFVVGDGVHVIDRCGENIGGDIYLTREEAEEALEKVGGEG